MLMTNTQRPTATGSTATMRDPNIRQSTYPILKPPMAPDRDSPYRVGAGTKTYAVLICVNMFVNMQLHMLY